MKDSCNKSLLSNPHGPDFLKFTVKLHFLNPWDIRHLFLLERQKFMNVLNLSVHTKGIVQVNNRPSELFI